MFKLPVGSSTGCKIYEQQYKQTVDGSKRVPEAAGRESLAITTQSITSSTRHIQPQAPQQCIQNIFPHSHDCSSVVVSYCGSIWIIACVRMYTALQSSYAKIYLLTHQFCVMVHVYLHISTSEEYRAEPTERHCIRVNYQQNNNNNCS